MTKYLKDLILNHTTYDLSDVPDDAVLLTLDFGPKTKALKKAFRQYSCPDKKITPDKVPLLKLMDIVWDMVDRVVGAPLDFYLPSTEPRKTWLVQSDYIKDLKDPTPFPMTDDQVGAYHQLIPADDTF